jgi:hypothetical protein
VTSEFPAKLSILVRNQIGVVTRPQALEAGLTRSAVQTKVASARWQTIYPGVYATFTGPLTRQAELWAAVLYAGQGAYLSHETAAEISRLTDKPSALISVTIPQERKVKAPSGIVIHRSAREAMIWRPPKIPPYTIAEETIIDLVHAATSIDAVAALVTSAFGRRLAVEATLRLVAADRRKLRWRRDLDEIITSGAGGAHSLLEFRHDRDVQRAHGLPAPVRQARFRRPDGTWGYRDRLYPEYGGLAIELDGKRFHPDERRGYDQDRDNAAAVAGVTLRYGWIDVTALACESARQEADALRNRGWTGELKPCSADCRAVGPSSPVALSSTVGPWATVGPSSAVAPGSTVAASCTVGSTGTGGGVSADGPFGGVSANSPVSGPARAAWRLSW